jgi:soluble lytic murein transglycosylase-like protein
MRFLLALLAALPVFAGEYAILNSGFRVHAERHEVVGDMVRLHTSTGNMDIPARDISEFEIEEYVKPAEPPKIVETPAAPNGRNTSSDPRELIETAAEKNGLLPEFVHSVASAESAYRQTAISPKGAIGLMQLMPGTAKELGADPRDPAQNAEAGARYLKQLLIKYQHAKDPVRLALAAYNAGPGAVDKYDGIPPYRETQQYVERVLRKYLAQLKSKKT